jgi:Big-like domain-containing protein
MSFRASRMKGRLPAAFLGMLALAVSGAVWAGPAAHASGGVDVFVGYADNLRANPGNFPTPWDGSPGVTFEGCTGSCTFDAGAVRIVNNSASPVTIDSVAVKISTCTFNMWPSANLAAGGQLIVTQTVTGASNGCASDGTMDTSDVGPNGEGYAGNCTPDGLIPEVDVSINGSVSSFSDTGQILNTGGVDAALCTPPPGNESTQWTPVGSAPCAGSSLMLAPASQHADIGGTAKVTATFTNSCGDPLQGASIHFGVTAGPNAGTTGTGTTDASGKATFSYSGGTAGTDTVSASTSNPAGTISSNDVRVIWDSAISATGGQSFTGTEPAAVGGTVATFTDPDPGATAGEYTASIDWGDGTGPSTGTVSGPTGGPFTVSDSHTYADEGSYSITVTITDADNAANAAMVTDSASVSDAALSAAGISPAPVSGQSFSGPVATFTDANATTSAPSDFTATIDWGDGSTPSAGTVTGSGGSYTVTGSHTYTGTGFFTVKVHIADDGGSTADARTTVLIFGTAHGGSFVIGDRNAATGTAVTFWGSQWWTLNTLSGGAGPASFKGFEDQPALPACGHAWTTDPGNSTPPPAGPLPAYMAVVVSSSVSQSGSAISGTTPSLVVVKTNPGYAADPGSPGTGTVVATIC